MGSPDHFVRGAVAFFLVSIVSTLISNLLNSPSNEEYDDSEGHSSNASSGSSASASAIQNAPREEGQVKWFNVSKGFGFITRDAGDDIFVHYRSIRGEGHRSLTEGQKVEYAVVDGDKGLQAEDVVPLSPAKRKGRR